MNYQQAKIEVKSRFSEWLEPAKMGGQFVCPICGHGRNGDGLRVVPGEKGGDGCRLHCFGCGFHGDVIDLYANVHHVNYREAFRELCRFFSLQVEVGVSKGRGTLTSQAKGMGSRGGVPPLRGSWGRSPQGLAVGSGSSAHDFAQRMSEAPPDDFKKFLEQAQGNIGHPDAVAYLESRGIRLGTARKYGLGFVPDWVSPTAVSNLRGRGKSWTPPGTARIIIPTSEGGYTARAAGDGVEPRFRKMKEGPAGLFNPGALYDPEGRPVFVVEGEFDALAVLEVGGLAVALGSVGNKGKLLELAAQRKPSGTLILALDNDDAGQDASLLLSEALQGLSVPFVVSDIARGYKDASEAISDKREVFAQNVLLAEQEAVSNPDGVGRYMDGPMEEELKGFRAGAFRRTGFEVLDDEAGGIYPGLYVLGAISSLGKTTFLHQMADQMAGAGHHVLYFSLEQSRLELVSKSIARIAAQRAFKPCFSSLDIRIGRGGENALEGLPGAFKAYRGLVGDRLSIIEGGFDCDVGSIRDYVKGYCDRFRVKPVVIVDYLQILQGGDERASSRERTDSSVIGLKRLSRELELPVFVVSSVNRANYLAPIDFESFKESGGIEYTADVVWGLQLEVLGEDIFGKEGKLREKREVIRKAKMAEPRRVELVCLKNRFGVSSYRVRFEYLAGCDWFRDVLPERESYVRY